MTETRWLILLLIVPLFACGGDDADRGGGTPEGRPAKNPVGSTFTPRPLDLDAVCLTSWELFPETNEFHPELTGRVLDPDGGPVPGATATLHYACVVPMVPPLGRESVVTDENGVFRFERVPNNSLVMIRKEGFAGEMFPHQVFVPVSDERAVVSLRPAGRIVGTAKLMNGAPAVGVTILLNCFAPDWFRLVVTDDEGRFAADDVPLVEIGVAPAPGRFRGVPVKVTCVPGEEAEVALEVEEVPPVRGTVVGEVTGKPLAGAVVRTLGERGEMSVVTDESGAFALGGVFLPMLFVSADGYGERRYDLDPAAMEGSEMKIALSRGAGVRGRVVDHAGQPVAGVRVTIVLDPEGAGAEFRGPLTGEDGTFDYTWIPVPAPDEEIRGFVIAVSKGAPGAPGPTLELRAGEVHEDAEITLPRRTTVSFRAVDEEGNPVSRCWAHLDGAPPDVPDRVKPIVGSRAAGGSDREGRFVMSGLLPGPHLLRINLQKSLPLLVDVVVEDVPEQMLPDVVCGKGFSIAGTVKGLGPELPPNLNVMLTDASDSFRVLIACDPDGSFEIAGLEEKTYTLVVRADRHEPVKREVLGGTRDVEIRLRALASLTVKLAFPGGVRAGGEVDIRHVQRMAASSRWSKVFKEEQDSVVYETVLPGPHHVRAQAREFVGLGEISVAEGEAAELVIDMRPVASVEGRVFRPGGELAFNVGVQLDAGKIWGSSGLTTDDRGIFRFTALPAGEVVVRCHPAGHPPTETKLDLAPGEKAEIELRLAAGATVDLTVVDPDGEPMEGVRVALNTEDGIPGRYWLDGREKANTGMDGKLRLNGIPPGRYLMTLFVGEDWRTRMTLDLEEGEIWNNEGRPLTLER